MIVSSGAARSIVSRRAGSRIAHHAVGGLCQGDDQQHDHQRAQFAQRVRLEQRAPRDVAERGRGRDHDDAVTTPMRIAASMRLLGETTAREPSMPARTKLSTRLAPIASSRRSAMLPSRRGYFTFMPGSAPLSGATRKMSLPPGPAASTMPSDTPKRILRGARLATTTTWRPTSCAGSYAERMPAKIVRLSSSTQVDRQLEQLVRAFDELRRIDTRDPQVDLAEFLDRDRGRPGSAAAAGLFAGTGFAAGADGGRRPPAGDRTVSGLGGCLQQRLDGCRVDTRRERLVGVDVDAEQRPDGVRPRLRRQPEEFLRPGRELRHHGLEVGRQHAEQVDALRADGLHLGGAGRVLRQQPGLAAGRCTGWRDRPAP